MLVENQQGLSPRLEPISNHVSPISSLSVPSISSLLQLEHDDSFSNRKRKQTTPQKLVRRRNGAAKKRRNSHRTTEIQNLLQEEAPELGSLKGDFNWNTIFDEFFGGVDTDLSTTPTSLASRASSNDGSDNREAVGRFSDDVVTGSLLAHDILISPECENSKAVSASSRSKTQTWHSPNDCSLHPTNENRCFVQKSNVQSTREQVSSSKECNMNVYNTTRNNDHDSIACFLNEAPQLDLSLTEPHVETTTTWDFFGPDLDGVLREKASKNHLEPFCPTDEIDRLFSSSSENLSVPETKSDISVLM